MTRYPGVRVVDVAPGPVVSRVSTNARFVITTEDSLPDGLTPNLCLKGYFGSFGSLARSAGIPEAHFYRDLEPSLGLRTLRSHYADVDLAAGHGVIITEDVEARGGVFLTSGTEYTADQVAESLAQLAVLHGATWEAERWASAPWLATRLARTLERRGLPEILRNFEGPNGEGVPVEVRDAQRLVDAYRALAVNTETERPWCVIHGDAHVGNLFLDAAGRPSFLDWQLVQRGGWHIDVGYHIASTLTPDDRRKHERELLTHYLECLAATGVSAPTFEEGWQAIPRGMLHGFFLWSITFKVEASVIAVLLHRLGNAVADHEALG
ncbi:MAG TPA: aminoglycoside phosphotransferase family protein [Frankiaceae bacterium]|nr:aminoglycoside phosphotransferase family protein [Frankiaceae bacterium]